MKKLFTLRSNDDTPGWTLCVVTGEPVAPIPLGVVRAYFTVPEDSTNIPVVIGEFVTEVRRPAMVRFELEGPMVVECPWEAVLR